MAEGDFGSRLPQIVLKRRTLPWERDPGGPALAPNDPPRPWLALVVIAEGEGALSPDPGAGRAVRHPGTRRCPTPRTPTARPATTSPSPRPSSTRCSRPSRTCRSSSTCARSTSPTPSWPTATTTAGSRSCWPTGCPIAVPAHRSGDRPAGVGAGEVPGLPGQPRGPGRRAADRRRPRDRRRRSSLVAAVQDLSLTGRGGAQHRPRSSWAPGMPVAIGSSGSLDGAEASCRRGGQPGRRVSVGVHRRPAATVARQHERRVGDVGEPGVVHRRRRPRRWPGRRRRRRGPQGDGRRLRRRRLAVRAREDLPLPGAGALERSPAPTTATSARSCRRSTSACSAPSSAPSGASTPTATPNHEGRARQPAPTRTTRRVPTPPELAETGHVGLPQTTRRGDAGDARGTAGRSGRSPTDRDPTDAPDGPRQRPAPDRSRPTGREDVSLAAAFEIGRLLGLSQPSLVSALVQWRPEQFGAARAEPAGARLLTERHAVRRSPASSGRSRPAGRDAGDDDGRRSSRRQVVGPARPVADPGRPIELAGLARPGRGRGARHRPRAPCSKAAGGRRHGRRRSRRPRSSSAGPTAHSTRPRSPACAARLDTELVRVRRGRPLPRRARAVRRPARGGAGPAARAGGGTGGRAGRARRPARRLAGDRTTDGEASR